MVEEGQIEPLRERRIEAMKKFALKNEKNTRFSSRWFVEKETLERETRPGVRDKYEEKTCRTEREKKNPVYQLTGILNEHYKES